MTATERLLRRELRKCIEAMALAVEPLPFKDPQYHEMVTQLGDRIGYGALMSAASVAWRERLKEHDLEGGEFCAGPCVSTVKSRLVHARAALKKKVEVCR